MVLPVMVQISHGTRGHRTAHTCTVLAGPGNAFSMGYVFEHTSLKWHLTNSSELHDDEFPLFLASLKLLAPLRRRAVRLQMRAARSSSFCLSGVVGLCSGWALERGLFPHTLAESAPRTEVWRGIEWAMSHHLPLCLHQL